MTRRRSMNLTELRTRAERAIAEGRAILAEGLDEPSSLELAHLIEELRVYQAELELQNEELNQAQDQLALAKERYRRLFNDLPVPAVVIDNTGFVVEANDQACIALGLSPQASLRRGALSRFLMSQDADRLSLRLRALDAFNTPARLESMHLKADGGVACYDLYLMPLTAEPSDSDPQTLVVLIDRSAEEALKALSAELVQSRLAAEQASAAKSSFLANMGHEIRTPLNAILGLSRLLIEGRGPLSAQQRDYLVKIHTAAEGLANLFNDILDYSKLADGSLRLEAIALSIEDLLANTCRLFASVAEAKGLLFECIADPRIPDLLIGDPLRIQQVLNHLVDNALKFTERGWVRVWVERLDPLPSTATQQSQDVGIQPNPTGEVEGMPLASPGGCLIRFTVSDTGRGLDPEQRQGLLGSPQPLDLDMSANRNPEGIGRGLSISRRLVELMGGRIGVESQPGQGSAFWFEIPLGLPTATAYPLIEPLDNQDVYPGPPHAASSSALPQPLEPAALQAQFKTLAWLLNNHLSRARTLNAEIERSLRNTHLQADYDRVARAIKRLDFETALSALQQLAAAQGWILS